jgi:rubrerythrin
MHEMTKANLKEAFAGESMAHMKYLIFSEQAEKDGYPEIARLFRAIAYAEKVHATNHLRVLEGIGDTATNLKTGIDGENYENTEMYPAFDAVAKMQKEKGAIRSFHYAREAELIHEKMYGDAKASAESGEDIPAASVHVCPVCGHTVIGDAPDKCPVCGLLKEKYIAF